MFRTTFFALTLSILLTSCASAPDLTNVEPIQYVALGDSYTEGTGVEPTDAWPVLLTNNLQQAGLTITLKENLAKAGSTTTELTLEQLPQLASHSPNLITLFIGANDLFQGVSSTQFTTEYTQVVKELLRVLPEPKRLVLVNIPDYSKTPVGRFYPKNDNTKNFAERLKTFNSIITEVATTNDLPVADVHQTSSKFGYDFNLLSNDRLHPSRKGHELWEEIIREVVVDSLLN